MRIRDASSARTLRVSRGANVTSDPASHSDVLAADPHAEPPETTCTTAFS